MRTATRIAAGVLAVALLAGAAWLAWTLTAQRISAAMGLGPPDGVVVVEECYEVSDSEGYNDGTNCRGRFTPAGGGADQARPIVVHDTSRKHPAGTLLPVRLAKGVAHEPSASPAIKYGIAAAMILVLGAVSAGWLLTTAWRGRAPDGSALLTSALVGLMAVAVLGIAAGLLAGIVALFL
ncbi:hypothetical protein ACFRMQ_15365 [Kitasatospora sp. NPDC056783]|uniref:hypothetical protein n=1 Tax=Kitasatospora sp. NPDC056783 TaxID=3345943 RepID=UPI0036CFEB93